MRRVQLNVGKAGDDALSAEAAQAGTSRSQLMRTALRQWLGARCDAVDDPVGELVGSVDIEARP